jgi:hypothetical protein
MRAELEHKNERSMLRASFVRTVSERDRIYVTRSDGSEVTWVFATYGDVPPHDMVHFIVESAFGVSRGFWGRVDAGIDPGVIAAQANRLGGRNKYAAFGDDQSELVLAEVLANGGWFMNESLPEALYSQIVAGCREAGLQPPLLLSPERAAQVGAVLWHLAARWRGLKPKGAITLFFDPRSPGRAFEELLAHEGIQ